MTASALRSTLSDGRSRLVVSAYDALTARAAEAAGFEIVEFTGSGGKVEALHTVEVEQSFEGGRMSFNPIEGTEREFQADLVLLALGFVGPETGGLLDELGVGLTDRGNVARDDNWMSTVPGVFVAGDIGRGQSLIVWAIAEGRAAAAAVDEYLTGDTLLPTPLVPTAQQLR